MPVNSKTCTVSGGGLVQKGYKASSGETGFVKQFLKEDKDICERVQKGMESEFGSPGQLVEMEKIVVDFHQYIANRIFNTKSEEYYIEAEELKRFF